MNASASLATTARDAAIVADDAEALAFADLYAAAPAALQARLGLRVAQVADARLLLAPGLPTSMFNRVIGLGLRQPAGMADIESIVGEYRAADCKTWWLHWNPYSSPSELVEALPGMGFTQPARRSWAKVLRGTDGAPRWTQASARAAGTMRERKWDSWGFRSVMTPSGRRRGAPPGGRSVERPRFMRPARV